VLGQVRTKAVIDLIEMHDSTRSIVGSTLFSLLSLVALVGCALGPKQIGDLGDESESGDGDQTGDGDPGDGDPGDGDPGDGDPGDECAQPSSAELDPDCDGVGIACDNARQHSNPEQGDQDQDGFGDITDLCPLTHSEANSGDSDKDGIGNDCDTCRQTIDQYNLEMAMIGDPRMWVRNVPFQGDFDQDGIGDACDNCVSVANCGGFDLQNPHTVGDPVPYDDSEACQTDANSDMIGDACIDPDTMMPLDDLENAAGPVGFGVLDDFDQDGIINSEDWCPRQSVDHEYGGQTPECTDDSDCSGEAWCAPTSANDGSRRCNHQDFDGDLVGDACDTCPHKPNPMQVTDVGMQIDDEDGDFVGADCETISSCTIRKDARPITFMEVAVSGMCCTTMYPGDGVYVQTMQDDWVCEGLCDPDGFPITRDCADEAIPGQDVPDGSKCRLLPPAVASLPGMLELPPHCDDALEAAQLCAPSPANNFSCGDLPPDEINRQLTLADIGDDDLLWNEMCSLAQWDQDFDGLGDTCDLCPFAFDPYNEPYVDDYGVLWPDAGAACSGVHQDQGSASCMLY
jgi:hypothetical protein